MKRCPRCNRVEADDSLAFCRTDGTSLVWESVSLQAETAQLRAPRSNSSEVETSILPQTTDDSPRRSTGPTTALRGSMPEETQQLPRPKRRTIVLTIVAFAILATVVAALVFYRRIPVSTGQISSVAVMPFVNESGNPDVDYLTDGMTETLINSLSQIPNLSVKARSSVFRYKGKEVDLEKIGSELNVQAILTGRIVKRGDLLTLSLELIDAHTENALWGNKYERTSSDLVTLQSEIARDVSSKLKTKLTGAEEQKVAKIYTTNSEANRLFLQGRFHLNKRTGKDAQKAIEYFQQAVELDPNYALAFAGMADTYTFLTYYGDVPPRETFPKARENALKALALDNTLAEAYSTLALISFFEDHDFAAFERYSVRAIELNPNYMDGHRRNGLRLMWLGRFDDARREINKALEIEPLSVVANMNYAMLHFYEGKVDESEALMKRALELDPTFWFTHYYLFKLYRVKGNHALAVEAIAKVQELRDNPEGAKLMRDSFAKAGWQGLLKSASDERTRTKLSPYIAATMYAEMGEKDKAFAALNETMERYDQFIGFIKIDPLMNPLRSDPRFTELMRKAGFPQ